MVQDFLSPVPHRSSGIVAAGVALALLRILSSYSWLSGALVGKDAKFESNFLAGPGLVERILDPAKGFAHTAVSPDIGRFLTGTVVPHASLFAWLIALSEVAIGLSMLLGFFARLGGLVAIMRCITNVLVAGTAAETVGHNYMLAVAGLVVLISAAGRVFGVDGLLVPNFPDSNLLRCVA
jgi:thiosulfate dehydrogenase (quinone) large subunit